MHITGLCPFCRSAYQVPATLRGKPVRCPNAACNKIFAVPAEVPSAGGLATSPQSRPDPEPVASQRSGTVGDLVPILPAEEIPPPLKSSGNSKHVSELLPVAPVVPATGDQPPQGDWWQSTPPVRDPSTQPSTRSPSAPESPPAPSEVPWWQSAPPPVRHPQKQAEQPATTKPSKSRRPAERPATETQPIKLPTRPANETQPMPALTPEEPGSPRELPQGSWEPPPVRRGQVAEIGTAAAEEMAESVAYAPRVTKRHAWGFIVGMTVFVLCAFAGFGGWAWYKIQHSEENLRTDAYREYSDNDFRGAAEDFEKLAKKFPNGEFADEYRFMAEWSALSHSVTDPDSDPSAAIAQLNEFVQEHKKKNDPYLMEKAHDAGQRLLKITKSFAARYANPTDEEPLTVADALENLRRRVASLDGALSKDDSAQIAAEIGKVRKAVQLAQKRRKVIEQLSKQERETWMEAIKRTRSLLVSMERELPRISQDAESQSAIARLYEGHLKSVMFHARTDDPGPLPRIPEDDADPLLFAPLLPSALPRVAPPNDPIVLALVHGILYALKQSTGELVWATRVGIDTTVLPQHIPASAFSPELLLVMSADTQTLTALSLEGDPLWEYHVGQPVLGRPVILEQRAFLADYAGWVHEIELSRGQLLGRWYLGQPLTRGGAREGNTSRIYFPADDSCIYVLDVNPQNRRCLTILYDGHPSGSLRSEPIIIPQPEGENLPGYLILNQASGLDGMQLQVFELPLQDRHAAPQSLNPPARLAGWTWFEPKADSEKLAALSDAGILGLFGVKQPGNQDQALFPLLPQGGLDLSPFLPSRKSPARERGRSQLVHMQGEDLWVLARGQLQQMQLRMDWIEGPGAIPRWETPLNLGSPLHEAQRIVDRNTGQSTFYLVTQALEQRTCLATAVEDQGKIVWQRQLGLVCQGEPLVLTPPSGGPPLLLALDQGGGLFTLDPSVPTNKLRSCWRYLEPALAENPLVPPRLLLAPDGHSAFEVAAPGNGESLLIRHIQWVGNGRALRSTENSVSLRESSGKGVLIPAGPPILLGSKLIMALSDGNIMRMSLEKDDRQTGTKWRASGVPDTATCHLLALSADRFLCTDGSRGLNVYEWRSDEELQSLPKDGEPLNLEHLVAAPPVLVPNASGQQPGVVVTDSAGELHLLLLEPDGALKKSGRSWKLDGNLTVGPFAQETPEGWRIGCVLDRRRLIWLDPAKQGSLWTYTTDGPAIIGQPQRIGDMLVIALQSGRYVGLNPLDGKPKGKGYTLRTSAAPAATPVPFGDNRMFAPLTDGSALPLSLERLREPAKK